MIHKVVRVETRGYILVCYYSAGAAVEYDMTDIVTDTGSMVEPLKDPAYFVRVFLASGVPTWPNGFDVCSEAVFREGKHLTGRGVSA